MTFCQLPRATPMSRKPQIHENATPPKQNHRFLMPGGFTNFTGLTPPGLSSPCCCGGGLPALGEFSNALLQFDGCAMQATSCVLQRCGPNTHRRTHEITTITLTVRVSVVRKPIKVGGGYSPHVVGWLLLRGGLTPPMEKSAAAAAAGGGDPSPGIAQLLLRGVNPPPPKNVYCCCCGGG